MVNTLKKKNTLAYFAKNLYFMTGIVLVWRGLWYVIEQIDYTFFNGEHFWTAVAGVILGFILLYIPDGDLKEIEKL
ncbi:MAG: hypothetical protein HGA67_03520 [Candidatus Yonathbacteria bacterium]|nr:hypothetical protein [Candidatus Yonathbacteria bacterium]